MADPISASVNPGQVRIGGEVRVNTTLPDEQSEPAITVFADGSYVVAWQAFAGGTANIYFQRYDAAGVAQGAETLVSATVSTYQAHPSLATLADGSFVVVWESTTGSSGDIYSRRYSATGTALAAEVRVNATAAGNQTVPDVAALEDGGYVVSWTSQAAQIYTQRYTDAGVAAGGETRVDATSLSRYGTVVGLPDGDYVVVWSAQDAGDFGVYMRRYDADGVPRAAQVQVSTTTADYQWFADVAVLNDGGFVIAWTSNNQDGEYNGIYTRRYDALGAALTGEVRANSDGAGNQQYASVSALSDGGYVVGWETDQGIYARTFDAAGAPQGTEMQLHTAASVAMGHVAVAGLPGGGFIGAWQSIGANGFDVLAQRVGPVIPATEQASSDLKGLMSVTDAGGAMTVTLSVDYGVLTVSAGGSGAGVSGSGTASVTLTGTADQINALLSSDASSTVGYTANTDAPPASATLTLSVAGGGSDSAPIAIAAVNDAPGFVGLDARPGYTEGGGFFRLDANAMIADPELGALDDYGGLTLTVSRWGGAQPSDFFAWIGTGASWETSGNTLRTGGLVFATYTNSNAGYLSISFNSSQTPATAALVNDVMQRIVFRTSTDNPPSELVIAYGLSDGNAGAQGSGGAGSFVGSITVAVTPVNDPLVQAANAGLTLGEGATAAVTWAQLDFNDLDQIDTGIVYTVTTAVTNGTLQLSGAPLGLGGTFTQDDLNNSRVTYVHDGGETTGASFGFSVTDGQGSTITGQTFAITVTPVNDLPVQGANAGLTLDEGASATITSAMLSYSDVESATLTYTVTTNATNGALRKSGVALGLNGTFTQADIDNGLITYLHNGGETLSASFGFSVSDGTGGTLAGRSFAITVNPVNDAPVLKGLGAPLLPWNQSTLNLTNSSAVSSNVTANDFTLAQSTTFFGFAAWLTDDAVNDDGVFASFGGTLSWAIYSNAGGLPGTLLHSGQDATPQVDDIGVQDNFNSDVFRVAVDFPSEITLAAGTYWLALHEGNWGSANDGSQVWWLFAPTVGATRKVSASVTSPGSWASSQSPADNAFVLLQANPAPSLAFAENLVNAEGQLLNGDVSLSDSEGNFAGGTVSVGGLLAEDVVAIRHEGSAAGKIGVSGANVTFGGTVIGSFAGGDGATLTVTLNGAATSAAVEALIQKLTYANSSDTPTASRTLTITVTDAGGASAAGSIDVTVTAEDDVRVATPDTATVAENATVAIDVAANDIDPDSASAPVVQINRATIGVGQSVTIDSGAKVRLNADGTLSYDPNGQFNHLVPPSSGAVNATATDAFSYVLGDGTTALVTVTITGVHSIGDRYEADSGDNVLTGTAGANLFMLADGGSDTVSGGGGEDGFYMGGALDAGDQIDGGTFANTFDQLGIQGNYTYTFSATNLIGIEILVLLSGNETSYGDPGGNLYTYNLTTVDANVAAGQTLTINGNQLFAGEDVFFDGSAETDGHFRFNMSGGDDVLIGGDGNDIFNGVWGQDTMTGGGGNDVFNFLYTVESAPAAMDAITDFTAGDRINLSAIDANATVGGNQAFVFIGSAAFGNTAGQLRVTGSGTDWIVEVDVNGDGVADMAIEVTTTVSGHGWSAADFVL